MATEKQRREAQRRHLQRQLQRRRQQAARRRRNNVIASIIGALVIVGLVVFFVVQTNDDDSTPAAAKSSTTKSASASPTASASSSAAVAAYPCTWAASTGATVAKKVTKPSTTTPPKTGTVTVAVTTSQGPMTFTLDRAKAPCAVASFVSLAQQKYFDASPCHRLTTANSLYVLQCGDPTGTGQGGPGYQFGDELTGKEKYTTGVLAMANAGANTNGSQFFIVYKNSTLAPSYTIFGSVTKGLAVVDKVAAKGANPTGDGKPKLPITLTKVTVPASAG
jgi:cyclophilin family peptidyl-prolyl cis-trans isomerase